jgi:hypothetical protein
MLWPHAPTQGVVKVVLMQNPSKSALYKGRLFIPLFQKGGKAGFLDNREL